MNQKDKRYLGKVEYELLGASHLKVSMESTGFQGGDAGHGGETTVVFQDLAATCWKAGVVADKTRYDFQDNLQKVALTFRGDEEMRNFYQAIVLIKGYLDEVLKY